MARSSRIRRPAARWNHRSLLSMTVKPARPRAAIPAARYQIQATAGAGGKGEGDAGGGPARPARGGARRNGRGGGGRAPACLAGRACLLPPLLAFLHQKDFIKCPEPIS